MKIYINMKYRAFICILILALLVQISGMAGPLAGNALLDSLVVEAVSGRYKDREDTNRVKLLYLISSKYRHTNADEGLKYGAMALALAKKLNWEKGTGEAYFTLGLNYNAKSDYEKAVEYWTIALKFYRSQGKKMGVFNVTNNIGTIKFQQGDYSGALENFFAALKIVEELGDVGRMSSLYNNLSGVYSALGDGRLSLEYSMKSLALAKASGKQEVIAQSFSIVGSQQRYVKQYDSAHYYFAQSLQIYEKLGNSEGKARTLLNIGLVYLSMKSYKKGLEHGMVSLEIYRAIGSEFGVAAASDLIGDLYLSAATDSNIHLKAIVEIAEPMRKNATTDTGMRALILLAADSYFNKAIPKYIELKSTDDLQRCYFSLSEVRKLMGDYKGALENYKLHILMKDSVSSVTTNVKIASLGAKRELELKESRIKLLSQENKLKDLRAAKDKQTRKALVGGIGMVVVIALSLVMYYVRRQQSEKLIANEKINTLLKEQELQSVSSMLEVQEQERKRIAADLHDRLGSMLSTVKLYFNTVEEQIDNLKEQNKEQYHKATTLLDEACDEVRKISHNLVSGELVKFGLVSAINQLKGTIEDSGKLKMSVLAFGMEERLDSAMEISLYRIVQELMNNMLKHAKATEVTIQLNRVDHNLNIVVEDNGVGFDVEAALDKDGMGLRNMETRVKKMQGGITFDSGKGRGTTTIIDIPV